MFNVFYPMKTHLKLQLKLVLLIAFFLIFSTLSCEKRYSDEEFASIIRTVKDATFSKLLPLTNQKMSRLIKTDEASLLCIGLHLYKRDKVDEAVQVFRFASENCAEPFKTICYEKLFFVSSDAEKIVMLDRKIDDLKEKLKKTKKNAKKEIEAEIEKLEKDKLEHEFFAMEFEKFDEEIPTLFAKRAMSAKLYLIYQLMDDSLYNGNEDFKKVIKMRHLTSLKKYKEAYEEGIALLNEKSVELLRAKHVFYDFLRCIFFASKEHKTDAEKIIELLKKHTNLLKNNGEKALIEYLAHLYLGRLYEKSGKAQYKEALKYYEIAVKEAPTPYDFDDSNWFRLKLELKTNTNNFVQHLASTMPKWDDHEWYEDVVAEHIVQLVASQNYKGLLRFYTIIENSKLDEQKAKLKYILARVGLIDKKKAFKEVYKQPHNLIYYTLLSAYMLGLPEQDVLYKKKVKREANKLYTSEDAMKILNSYIRYGLHSLIQREVVRIYPTITVAEAYEFAKELQLANLVPDSITLVQFAMNSEGATFKKEHLNAVYPRPHYAIVKKWCDHYKVPEYIMYALIRSESFFRVEVASHVGAQGLAQLMPSTARDIAKSLKIKKYDVLNPDTNINFGTYYLAQMIKRFDGHLMPAMCAYNAGPVAVSRWLRNNKITDEDIFVESIPYEETRNYGKKLLYTACMYAYIYYNKSPKQVIKEVFTKIDK